MIRSFFLLYLVQSLAKISENMTDRVVNCLLALVGPSSCCSVKKLQSFSYFRLVRLPHVLPFLFQLIYQRVTKFPFSSNIIFFCRNLSSSKTNFPCKFGKCLLIVSARKLSKSSKRRRSAFSEQLENNFRISSFSSQAAKYSAIKKLNNDGNFFSIKSQNLESSIRRDRSKFR